MSLPIEQTWLILVDLMADLRRLGVEIPSSVVEDIRLAKTTINFYKVNPNDPERMKELKRVNDFLNSAQEHLLALAEKEGHEYVDKWIKLLQRASRGEIIYKSSDTKPRFVVGAPAGFSMVRITFQQPISEDRVQEIAEEYKVILEFEEDNVIAIYGDDDNIKRSLKELSSFFKE